MDIYIFFLCLVAIVFSIIGLTSYLEAKVAAGSKVSEKQFSDLSCKLEKALARIETLEELATDEDELLKQKFRTIKKSA